MRYALYCLFAMFLSLAYAEESSDDHARRDTIGGQRVDLDDFFSADDHARRNTIRGQEQHDKGWNFLVGQGVFHETEVPEKPGPGWLALAVLEGKWQLVPAKIRATPTKCPPEAPDSGGRCIQITTPFKKVMAFVRAGPFSPGPVATPDMRFFGEPREIQIDKPLKINLKGKVYEFVVIDGDVHLRRNGITRRLPFPHAKVIPLDEANHGFYEQVSLVWAGDIDRDGALDFMIKYSGAEYLNGTCLFLSSRAVGDEWVGHFSCFSLGVC